MVVYAVSDDVLDRWIATALPPDHTKIEQYLQEASIVIDSEFPNLRSKVEAGNKELAERAKMVAVRMAIRVLQNPDRIRQTQEGAGPYTAGVTYASETLGDVRLTKDDKAIISGSASKRKAFTVDNTPSFALGAHADVCALRFGANYCSCGSDINRGAGAIYETND